MLAAIGGHYNVVQILLASPRVANVHTDYNSNGDTALSLAEWYGHIDIVQLLESAPMEQVVAARPASDSAVPSGFCTASLGQFAFWISILFVILSVLFSDVGYKWMSKTKSF
jgi:ankyrin repeat protein